MKIAFTRLTPDATMVFRHTPGAAGFDLTSRDAGRIDPGRYKPFRTGIALSLPHDYEAQIRPRSGLALRHGITVLNSPGTIDSDYRGEIVVVLINHGRDAFEVDAGDRIAQLVIAPLAAVELGVFDQLDETERGAGGFGSTGISQREGEK